MTTHELANRLLGSPSENIVAVVMCDIPADGGKFTIPGEQCVWAKAPKRAAFLITSQDNRPNDEGVRLV